jgi:hypothetical protein
MGKTTLVLLSVATQSLTKPSSMVFVGFGVCGSVGFGVCGSVGFGVCGSRPTLDHVYEPLIKPQ